MKMYSFPCSVRNEEPGVRHQFFCEARCMISIFSRLIFKVWRQGFLVSKNIYTPREDTYPTYNKPL